MVAPASTSWLDPFLDDWRPGSGEPREIREPATGRPLLTIAQSTVDDVAEAARRAKAAQPAWAETSYDERARILRRAAEIYEAHRPEFGSWTQRETGAVHGKMHHEQNFAVGELHAAATMPFAAVRPARAERRPGAALDAPPGPGRRHRRDHAVELPERAGHARRRAGPRPGQRRRSSSPTRRRRSAAAPCSRRCSARPACPTGCSRSSSATPRSARRIVTDPNVDPDLFTGSTEAGRRVGALAGERLKRVTLELGGNNAFVVLDDADLEAAASAGAFASFQFQGQVCFADGPPHRPSQRRRRLRRACSPRRRSGSASATRSARRSTSARSSTSSSSRGSTASSGARSTRARGSSPAASTTACSTARPSSPT